MRRFVAIFVAGCSVVGCGSGRSPAPQRSGRTRVAGGCGATRLYRGGLPAWTAPAFSSSSGPQQMPYAVAQHGNAVAMMFAFPLRAGDRSNPANKVLWIMRLPRRGSSLAIRATRLHGHSPLIRITLPADASPGEIYPSYVNVPRAGCWHLALRWAHHADSIDLRVSP